MNHFLITGGEGFIGRNLARALRKRGDKVFTLDISGNPDFRISITDKRMINQIGGEFDGIFHLASVTSPTEFERDAYTGVDVNINGTLNVLEYAKQTNVPKVVLASSSSIYTGISGEFPETFFSSRYANLYPITKLFNEYLSRYYLDRNELNCISLRFFNTYGVDESSKINTASVPYRFVRSALKCEPIIIYGDGTQSRDFVYINDCVNGIIKAFENGRAGETYNIGTGISTSYNDLAKMILKVTKSSSEIKYIGNPLKHYQYFTKCKTDKSERELNFKCSYTVETAIEEMFIEMSAYKE